MRHEPTPTETALWSVLRAKRFAGVKFSKQVVIAPYIVGFVARSYKLIVEIDGDTHAQDPDRDMRRTRYLEDKGYRVLRFTNYEIGSNLEGVAHTIAATLQLTDAERKQ